MEQWKRGACQELAREAFSRKVLSVFTSLTGPGRLPIVVHAGPWADRLLRSVLISPASHLSPIKQCQAASGFRLNLQHPFEGFRSLNYSQKVVRGPPPCSSSWAVRVGIFLMDAQDLHHLSSHACSPGAPLIIWQPLQLTAPLLHPAQHAVKLLQAAILLLLTV